MPARFIHSLTVQTSLNGDAIVEGISKDGLAGSAQKMSELCTDVALQSPTRVVGIGASAGGLEALERLFGKMPPDTGMAFVVVQHLSPHFRSLMNELLANFTQMPIHVAEDGMPVAPNAIYLMPPTKEMIILDGKLLLTDKKPGDQLTLPIDQFFRSLARDAAANAVAVVLSGTGSDGSRGIRDVHTAGGLVIVQSSETAKFDGMPRSAVETGIVDLVLAPEEVADALQRSVREPQGAESQVAEEFDLDGVPAIFGLLRNAYGIDFSYYRPTTVERRLQRRLQLLHAEDLQGYVQLLKSDPQELDALYNDLLIGVTGFFRDAAGFQSLQTHILQEMLARTPANGEFRAWVAGCATGEEAYSLAILIREQLEALGRELSVKIFATDVHRASLDKASNGHYPADALTGISQDRLDRHFHARDNGYQVNAELRQMVVFAHHNITGDAPFTRLDLITCRNLLIYLEPVVQKKALCLFHFGLKTGGALFLGPSESPGEVAEEFEVIDQHWKIFRKRRDVRLPPDLRLPLSTGTAPRVRPELDSSRLADRHMNDVFAALLEETLPPSVLLNERREILHSFGEAHKYLQLPRGKPSLDVLELLHDDLRLAAAGAIYRATRGRQKIIFSGIRTCTTEGEEFVHISAQPINDSAGTSSYTLLMFQRESDPDELSPDSPASESDGRLAELSRDRVEALEAELRLTKENLQATIEELEANNEEMQATNQEMLAANEELQSTNEELHSVNEELYTVNAEYQKKIAELTELTDDMDNLLLSTEVHTIFLDERLCIRKFTPRMAEVFNLIPDDVGRRIDGFVHTIRCEDLQSKLADVLQHGTVYEEEVRINGNEDFLMRILPYRGDSNCAGIVMTLVNITGLKLAENLFRKAVEAAPSGMVMIDERGTIQLVNSESERMFQYSREELLGQQIEILMPQRFRSQHVSHREQYFQSPRLRPMASGVELIGQRKDGSEFPLDVRLSPITTRAGLSVLAAIVDVTDRRYLESSLRTQVVQRDRFLATLSHELRNPMAAILNASSLLTRLSGNAATVAGPCGVIRRQASRIAALLDDLLDVTRITQNKVKLRREVIDLTLLGRDAIEAVTPILTAHPHDIQLDLPEEPLWVDVDRARILQVFENLLTNAIKYSPDRSDIWVTLERDAGQAVLSVSDEGRGIPKELLGTVFDMFVQGDDTLDRSEGGMGVGLTLVRSLVDLHQGSIEAFSEGMGCGSKFVVRLPLTERSPQPVQPGVEPSDSFDLRIALVEDSDDTRDMLAALLAFDGFQVLTAPDGQQGLELILNEKPDVALVDIGLPGLDGYEVARRVRAQSECQQTRLIALTGYGRKEDHEAVLAAGFDEHLVKPVTVQALKTALAGSTRSEQMQPEH